METGSMGLGSEWNSYWVESEKRSESRRKKRENNIWWQMHGWGLLETLRIFKQYTLGPAIKRKVWSEVTTHFIFIQFHWMRCQPSWSCLWRRFCQRQHQVWTPRHTLAGMWSPCVPLRASGLPVLGISGWLCTLGQDPIPQPWSLCLGGHQHLLLESLKCAHLSQDRCLMHQSRILWDLTLDHDIDLKSWQLQIWGRICRLDC